MKAGRYSMSERVALESSGFKRVRLTGGRFREQQDATLAYYLAIDDDDLLWGFRTRAGLPAPGRQLDGWYGGGVYHVFGQLISGLVRLSQATGDQRGAEKAVRLLEGWSRCLDGDGYGFHNPRERAHDRYYEYDKLVGGLVDSIEYLDSDVARRSLSRLTDWALVNLDVSANQTPHDAPHGTEWYTLSENLYRAFVATGDEKYRNFAGTWEYPQHWDRYLDPQTFTSVKKHAYSHVNTLSGAAMAYRVHGDERYLRIITNAFDILSSRYLYATGGYGPCERLFGDPGYLGESILHAQDDGWGHMEVSCSSWAVFKLCRYLLEFTGDPRYADWAEKVLYNCMAAELLPRPGGKIMYYADYYVIGARKSCDDGRTTSGGATFEWPCCTGTFPQAVAEYANLAGFHSADGIHVTQYLPAVHRWTHGDDELTVEVTTRYPEEDTVRLAVGAVGSPRCALSLRRPTWAEELSVRLNGKPTAATVRNGWVALDRAWRDGDVVDVRIPQSLRFQPVDAEHSDLVALIHGPVVLASDSAGIMTGPVADPGSWIERTAGDALGFETLPGNLKVYALRRKRFKPYYDYAEGETYHVYNRIDASQGR